MEGVGVGGSGGYVRGRGNAAVKTVGLLLTGDTAPCSSPVCFFFSSLCHTVNGRHEAQMLGVGGVGVLRGGVVASGRWKVSRNAEEEAGRGRGGCGGPQ